MRLTRLPLVAALALAACAHPAAAPAPPFDQPTRADLEFALMPLDFCAGDDSGTCDSAPMPEHIRILASRCAPLAPRDGAPVVACRMSWRQIYSWARMNRSFTHACVRLSRNLASGGRAFWTRDYVEPGPDCERAGLD